MNFIFPSWLAPSNIKALTTTRLGGFSQGNFSQFNLAVGVGEDEKIVQRNRALLKDVLHLSNDPVWLTQVHGTRVVCLDHTSPQNQEADASYTTQAQVVCAVTTADCLPLLLCDEAGTCVAAIHAGWKGLAAGVIEQTIQQLPVHPDTLLVWLGPAIGPTAFKVEDDVKSAFPDYESCFQFLKEEKKWTCDIYQIARLKLNKLGITRIYGGEYCTYTQQSLFYSYRAQKQTGRMASLIWLTSKEVA